MSRPDQTQKLLTTFLRRLTNLSGNNRSIFLPRAVSEQFLDLQQVSQLNGEPAFSIINALIAEKQKTICPVLDSRMEAANEASKKLKKLQRLDKFLWEERGSKDLHIGWPFVRGKFSDGTLVRCPLLFFPVELVLHSNQWAIRPREDAEITFNKSFLLAHSFYNKVKPDESLLEENFEDTERDSTVFRTVLYQMLQKSTVDINFNSDNYRDELISFENFKKDEFEKNHKNGELKLFPEAVLGIFPQAGSFLVPDYLQLIEQNAIQDIEEFFQQRSHPVESVNQNFLSLVKEERIYPVFPQDIWQENALKASKLGHSLVVQGPPGTGKSQLICNLIGDAMASGKRVLIVCQKRAALDVVYARMKEHQLNDFLALVHDFKNDRKTIFAKIAKQIERVDEYKSRNISLDSIQLDRRFLQISHRIDQITEELDGFRKLLFDDSESGSSAKELYLSSRPTEPVVLLKQEFQYFKMDALDDFLRKLKSYSSYAKNLKTEDYLWKDRLSFAGHTMHDLGEIKKTVTDVRDFFEALNKQLTEKLGTALDLEQCEAWLEQAGVIREIQTLLQHGKAYSYFQKMVSEPDEETSVLWFSNIEKNLMSCFDGNGPETNTANAQLGALQKALYRSMKARRSLIGLLRWRLFSKDKFLITRTLVANGLTSTKEGFNILERKLDSRLNLEHLLSKLRAKSWLNPVPETMLQKDFRQWFADQHFALDAKLNFTFVRGLKSVIDAQAHTLEEFNAKLDFILNTLTPIHERRIRWSKYLTLSQVISITRKPETVSALLDCLKKDFDALCEFDRLEQSLSETERSIIQKLYEENKSWDSPAIQELFLNSLRMTWLDHLESKYPELRMVSSGKLALLEAELQELIIEKHRNSVEILLMRARERVIDDLQFNRVNNRVTYRDLLHQVTKKKKIWPIRKIIQEFEEEVFKLIPCWLASPESVSAILPMKEMFDLVIFDEASQCFAERGIPALYRGKQALVAGDSMQLRPGDFYQTRWQEEEEIHPDAEIDSLLELCNRYVMSIQLKGHYRSKAMELIDFSNRHFYNGTLQLLPDLRSLNSQQPSLIYEKVDGLWNDNMNNAEAERIAQLTLQLLDRDPEKEIGIVTFNVSQQALVLDTLENAFRVRERIIPSSLFVKNIENVQGDERDIIIFSIGYAPDQKGKVNTQFGSLNLAGGENRLNVAVSRAREKIIVVTSLWPDQLHTEESKNEGPRLLKMYLQYVLNVSKGEFDPYIDHTKKKKHVYQLKQEIKRWADEKWPEHRVEENRLPFYDLTAKKAERQLGAILTDDDLYYQSLSAKADHALTPHLLEYKNWPYLRVYSRNFWQDPDKFFNEIGKFLNQ